MIYDYIIIGTGISGLYIANHLLKTNQKFLILEAKGRNGGRIKSIETNNLVYETGAYRISKAHSRSLKLLKQLDLTNNLVEIDDTKTFISREYQTKYKLDYNHIINNIIKKSSKKELLGSTIYSIIERNYDSETANFFVDYMGYHHITNYSNASVLSNLQQLANHPFYRLKGGLTQMISKLIEPIKPHIKYNHQLLDIEKTQHYLKLMISNNSIYKTRKIIITIPKENLLMIPYLYQNHLSIFDSVSSSSYLRLYAIYPKDKKTNLVWFHDINKTVTNTIFRQIIPIDKEKGLIELCYVDSIYAEMMRDIIIEGKLLYYINHYLKKLFPNKKIPEPIYVNNHFWKYGNHFWKPNFDGNKLMSQIINPEPNIYVAGESYSNYQGWIEGALQTSDLVIQQLNPTKKNKYTKKRPHTKYVTIKQLEKTNKKWTIIDNKVYDLTRFINNKQHPGGNVIEIAIGKDISKLYKSIGHSSLADNLLNKYYLGELKK